MPAAVGPYRATSRRRVFQLPLRPITPWRQAWPAKGTARVLEGIQQSPRKGLSKSILGSFRSTDAEARRINKVKQPRLCYEILRTPRNGGALLHGRQLNKESGQGDVTNHRGVASFFEAPINLVLPSIKLRLRYP